MSRRGRRFGWGLAAILLLGFGLRLGLVFSATLGSLGGRVDEWFLVDDSWYCLNIARNIAHGAGWTHDGVHRTNGFQPLFVFAMVPVYAATDAADRTTPVYVALVLLSLFHLGAAAWLGVFVRRLTDADGLALLAAGAFALSPNAIGIGVNGMETAVALFFAGAALHVYLRERDAGLRLRWRFVAGLGLLLGAGLWARLDLALLAVALGVDLASALLAARRLRELFAKGAALAALSVLVYAPFMALGYAKVGHPLPESGPAVRQLSLIRAVGPSERLPGYLVDNVRKTLAFSVLEAPILPNVRLYSRPDGDYFDAADRTLLVGGPLLLAFGVGVAAAARRRREAARRLRERLQPALLFVLLLVAAYALYVFGDHYFYRYLHPAVWVTLAAVLSALTLLPRRARLFLCAAFAVVFAGNAVVELRSMLDTQKRNDWGRLQVAAKASLVLSPGERVGAFQSGYVSYWDEDPAHPAVNLDGVVNGRAYEALRDQRLPAYLAEEHVRYVIDWANTRTMLVHGGFDGRRLAPVAVRDGIHILRIEDAAAGQADPPGPASRPGP